MDPLSDDAVFEAVRAAVDAGEYIDWLPAVRAQEPVGGTACGRPPQVPPGPLRYLRGSPEHLRARSLGQVVRLPRPPVATAAAVEAVEQATGCPLPPLLRRLFLEVANGGFGPGHSGILGAPGHDEPAHYEIWKDLLDAHRAFTTGPEPAPRHMLPLFNDPGAGS